MMTDLEAEAKFFSATAVEAEVALRFPFCNLYCHIMKLWMLSSVVVRDLYLWTCVSTINNYNEAPSALNNVLSKSANELGLSNVV